jgi:hypothetical protein
VGLTAGEDVRGILVPDVQVVIDASTAPAGVIGKVKRLPDRQCRRAGVLIATDTGINRGGPHCGRVAVCAAGSIVSNQAASVGSIGCQVCFEIVFAVGWGSPDSVLQEILGEKSAFVAGIIKPGPVDASALLLFN